MHKKNIAHRDIKPENILLSSKDPNNLDLKITDFGFAKCYDPEEGGLTETLGSPLYMAPEIIKKLPYDCSVDIWALGVLTYIMMCGKPPFKGRSKDDVFVEITTKNITYTGETWKNISKEAKSFIRKMLIRDPKQRSTAEDLLKDEFIINNVNQDDLRESTLLDIANNLKQFRKNSAFQAGVMTFIISQNETMDQIEELKKVFN